MTWIPVRCELVERFQNGRLLRHEVSGAGKQEQDAPVHATINIVKGDCAQINAAFFSLGNQLDDEIKNFVRVLLQNSLPQLVDQSASQVHDVRGNVLRASSHDDRQYALIPKNDVGRNEIFHDCR